MTPPRALGLERLGWLRGYTSTMLEQMLQSPVLMLGLASNESGDQYTLDYPREVSMTRGDVERRLAPKSFAALRDCGRFRRILACAVQRYASADGEGGE